MKNTKQWYDIEQINDKYYIFNKLILQFEKESFNSCQEAENYIYDMFNLCNTICN